MIEELSAVVLLVDLPEQGLRAGDVGTVVDTHAKGIPGVGYSVEFLTMSGDTVAVVELEESQIRPTRPTDIAHVREMASA
ncbi:MAG: DUF4926 domain-containing protein [Chloroflexota bacterium]|nr:DUF4926 domain-containing protein [Chloroflexota bacterium]